ncbi:MAG: alpha/beta fold hydrolase, partial [Caulobacteraceae bacterium]
DGMASLRPGGLQKSPFLYALRTPSAMTETAGFLERDGAALAWRRLAGERPTVVWLGGFGSEMTGTKAAALADWARARGRAFLRFDYFGHGRSGGRFEEGVITRWRADALAAIDELTSGPLVLVGSSMGGWLACLAAMARPERTSALVLIAPAADFTEKLLAPNLPPEGRAALAREGVWSRGPGAPPITRALVEDGERWSILPGPVAVSVPVRILQGAEDTEVPWTHALDLARAFKGEDVVFILIGDGDHRLSRPRDLRRIISTVEEVLSIDEAPAFAAQKIE